MLATLRVLTRGVAELLITLGLVVVAFAAYLLVWGDVQSAMAQSRLRDSFAAQVEQVEPPHQGGRQRPVRSTPAPADGGALGVLRIPRLGADWSWVMVEGVADEDIALGPGHFPGTSMPGEVGNFAVAGHRATHGEPFAHLDAVVPGDEVYVQTATDSFTYVVDSNRLVSPGAVDVIAPVPGQPGVPPTQALITLVTCNPRWGSTERMIVTGHLTEHRVGQAAPVTATAKG